MPIPQPKENESEKDFIQRFMSDKNMLKEFPKRDQRYQVQITTWKGKDKKSKPEKEEKNSSVKESLILRQKKLVENKSIDPQLKLNIIEAIQLHNKKYHLLEQINNERLKLYLNKIVSEQEDKKESSKEEDKGKFVKLLVKSKTDEDAKKQLIDLFVTKKEMSLEDATKLVDKLIAKMEKMSKEDFDIMLDKEDYKKIVTEQKKIYPNLDTLTIVEMVQNGINDKKIMAKIKYIREQEEFDSDEDMEIEVSDGEMDELEVETPEEEQEEQEKIKNAQLVGLYALCTQLKLKRDKMIENNLDTTEIDDKILQVRSQIKALESPMDDVDDTMVEQVSQKQKSKKQKSMKKVKK